MDDKLYQIGAVVIVLLVAIIAAGIGLKATGSFQDSMCGYTWDATENKCFKCPSSGNCSTGCTVNITSNQCYNTTLDVMQIAQWDNPAEINVTTDAEGGVTEVTGEFSTIGIVAVMTVIIMLIGGLTAYFVMK